MFSGLTLPDSWRSLLETFRPVFRRSPTLTLFIVLATGLVAQTARRTVVGMLAGAGMATVVSFHSVCRRQDPHPPWAYRRYMPDDPDSLDPRAKWRELPEQPGPDDWVAEVDTESVPGSVKSAEDDREDRETSNMLRWSAGGG